ncbi:class I SAM-dependent methyltransferase [Roseobacter weihaiensis]|uniref:class I SAM-dependent methyltransferase n=1 Tax=Roseobacter weihaiensis TaxID=2763262 RepID=UPI001D0B4F2D|nr:class I SAM-dependent methyltransferase [Roseobacter sp. H9]
MKFFKSNNRSSEKKNNDTSPAKPPQDPKKKKTSDPDQSSRLMNKIAKHLGFTDYLEVGVQGGVTFNAVDISHRDAVDPNFLFETSEFERETVRFFQMPSDEFFSRHCDKTYDLIFLDGLHTFTQCFRDFCAALQVLREGGVIVIDDTVPGDLFSSLATQDLAIAAREAHGLTGRAWTGDVFKVIPTIHNYFPNLSYVTLRNPDNPMYKPNTVLWRGQRADFHPADMDLKDIESLGYFDLPLIENLFNYMDYEDGLSLLFDSVTKP